MVNTAKREVESQKKIEDSKVLQIQQIAREKLARKEAKQIQQTVMQRNIQLAKQYNNPGLQVNSPTKKKPPKNKGQPKYIPPPPSEEEQKLSALLGKLY